jgi:DNA-directed RNA polymerase subunit RPC12/RpoP
MSNGYDLKDIAEHYSKKSDADIIHIATQNAAGLRPGVLEIIEAEIKKRNLDPNVLEGAKAQNREYSLEEINELSQKLRILPCPLCGSKTAKLNGTILHTVKSFIFFSTFRKEPIIACPDCLDKKNQESIVSTALLGWWGIPSGILKTPIYIYNNINAKKENRITESNGTLLGFTLQNIGQIETYKEDTEKLKLIIKYVKK